MQEQYAKLEKGTLLVASPDMEKGLFSRSVVLLCEHSTAGSFGLIINKEFYFELPEDVLSIQELSHPSVHLRLGGKMGQTQMMLLHTSNQNSDQTLKIVDDVYLGGDLPFLQDSLTKETPPDILLCFGYMGWQSGELEKEFMSGLWFLHKGHKNLLFQTPPEKIWSSTLKEMGGKYTSLSLIPEDLNLN